jgi:choline dehydrogenase-like flavoprotein
MTNSPPITTALEADYVIVGGGTAGLVLALRLSENPNTSVIVLEAGKDLIQDPRVQIPALWTTLMGTDADWQFQTAPQVSESHNAPSSNLDLMIKLESLGQPIHQISSGQSSRWIIWNQCSGLHGSY